jgi:hypothetical protein
LQLFLMTSDHSVTTSAATQASELLLEPAIEAALIGLDELAAQAVGLSDPNPRVASSRPVGRMPR